MIFHPWAAQDADIPRLLLVPSRQNTGGLNPGRARATVRRCALRGLRMISSARRVVINIAIAIGVLALLPVLASQAQAPRRAPETWWVAKTKGGVYKPPNRPLWKLADLLKMHAGQANWSEQIVKDPEQDATYNSAAPGTKFPIRMHPDTATLFVVVAGQMHFEVEGQQPVTATRGALVNIMHTTLYSYDVTGDKNALWVEVRPPNYQSV